MASDTELMIGALVLPSRTLFSASAGLSRARVRGAPRSLTTRTRPTLAAVDVPALALVGEEDKIAPPAVMEALAAGIRGARLERVPAAAHLAPLEQPLAATRILSEFFEEL